MAEIPRRLTRKVARVLHDKGIEMTLEQVESECHKAYQKIRQTMRKVVSRSANERSHVLQAMQGLRVSAPRMIEYKNSRRRRMFGRESLKYRCPQVVPLPVGMDIMPRHLPRGVAQELGEGGDI